MLVLAALFGMGGAMHLLMEMLMGDLLEPNISLLLAKMMMSSLDLGFFNFVLLVLLLLLLLDQLLKGLI